MEHTALEGTVFNIERGSNEDGPGIRTVVFLKGCGLRCKWCANPESQLAAPEIMHIGNVCVQCGRCVETCPQGAISRREGYGYITDRAKCILCLACVRGCYINARKLQGMKYTVDALVQEVLKDKAFFLRSGGGVTFSGGEPLLQAAFLTEAAAALRAQQVPSLVETCGFVPLESLQQAAAQVDAFFYDFKHIDPACHKALTGHDNRQILENLHWLLENFPGNISVRYPYIPGCNDDEAAIRGFLAYMAGQRRQVEVVFLPYHRLGLPKYTGLGRDYAMGNGKSLKREALQHILPWAAEYGVSARIQ